MPNPLSAPIMGLKRPPTSPQGPSRTIPGGPGEILRDSGDALAGLLGLHPMGETTPNMTGQLIGAGIPLLGGFKNLLSGLKGAKLLEIPEEAISQAVPTASETADLTQQLKGNLNKIPVRDDSGRVIAPPQGDYSYQRPPGPWDQNTPQVVAKYATHQPGLPGEAPRPMFNVEGGEYHGSTMGEDQLRSLGIPIQGGVPAYDENSIKAARDAAMARFNKK